MFWNYVDLRLRAPFDLRLEVTLDAESLMVRVRGVISAAPVSGRTIDATLESGIGALPAQRPGDCVTCGRDECFRNAPTMPCCAPNAKHWRALDTGSAHTRACWLWRATRRMRCHGDCRSHVANTERHPGPMRIYFPASSLLRKSAWELSTAMACLDAEIVLPMCDGGEPARWQDIALHRIDDIDAALSLCDAVVLPAWVEHELRVLIATIARGIPVIATAACGLGRLQGWPEVAAGDVDALRAALKRVQGTQPDHPRHT